MFGFTFLRISNIYSFLIQFIRNLVMMILQMWHLDHVKNENLNNQRKSSLTVAVHVYYSALQWQIYLLFVLDNFGRLLQTSNLVPAHETRRWNMKIIGAIYWAQNFFFFFQWNSVMGGSHLWELYYILSWHRDPPMILPNIILTCFRQWFSYFWHTTLLKTKNVHSLNPFVFVLNSSMAMLSVTGWFDLRQKMTAYQKKYK